MSNIFGQGPSGSSAPNTGFGSGIGSTISSGLSSISSGLGMGSSPTTTNVGFDSFYTMVLTIAIIILILVLAFLGWTMSKQKETDNFPKLQTTCPDFWGIVNNSGKTYCKQPIAGQVNYGDDKAQYITGNTFVPGYDEQNTQFDFTNSGWSAGGNAVCAKKKWANSHGINWDTVSNANYC